jgi:hypothetical protein
MLTYCSGRTLGTIIEEWCNGMQNSWSMTSNWYTLQEPRMDVQMHHLGAQTTCNQGEEDNKMLVVLPEGFFQRAYAQLTGSDEADPLEAHSWQQMTRGLDNGKYRSLQERIVKNQQKEASKKKISHWTNTYQMAKEHGVWWKEDWIVVARDNDLKRGVIYYFHDTPSAGHPRITNTYELVKHDIWWPLHETGCGAICQGMCSMPGK